MFILTNYITDFYYNDLTIFLVQFLFLALSAVAEIAILVNLIISERNRKVVIIKTKNCCQES